jgi:parallel beta-helix repeat protein
MSKVAESKVAEFLEKRNRQHTKEAELQKTKLPPLPAAPKRMPKATDADAVVGSAKGEHKRLSDAIAAVKPGGVIHVTPGLHPAGEAVETDKPFQIVGEGAQLSAVLFRPDRDTFLALKGKSLWKLEAVAILCERKEGACCDLVELDQGAAIEISGCVLAGALAVSSGELTTGGLAVRACNGGKASISGSLLAFNRWNVGAHDGAAITLERCHLFGAEFGAFVGESSELTFTGGELRRNQFGLKAYGEGGSIVARDVKIVDQTMTGVYIEKGRVQLESCRIIDNGTHGVGAEPGTEIVARQNQVDDNWECGFWIEGEAQLVENSIKDNSDHGIMLTKTSTGRVTGNSCEQNGGFGIVWDPASRVERHSNETDSNGREEEYELGTLEREVQAGLPQGVSLPESISKLARYQEANGRLAGETMYVCAGPLAGWPGLEQEFAVFGNGPDGSSIAFWLHDALPIDKSPIVYLDSEGVENLVIAQSMDEFLSILARGPEELRHGDAIEPDRDEDDEEELERLGEWLDEVFGVKPAKSIDEIRRAAEKAHPGLEERLETARK